MYSYTVWSHSGDRLERGEQEEPVDVEALVRKHDLKYWKRVWRVERFNMTVYTCVGGRINVKKLEEK